MQYKTIILILAAGVLAASCQNFSNKVEKEEAVEPFRYEMSFLDSKEGADKAFFGDNVPSFTYKVVLPGQKVVSKYQWKTILDEVHPDIKEMAGIYYSEGKNIMEKQSGIQTILDSSGERTGLQQSILEQVASCRMLKLLNDYPDRAPVELTAAYLEKLLYHRNTSYRLQLQALNQLEGYWDDQKIREAEEKLRKLAELQLSEAKTYLAAEDKHESELKKTETANNYEITEVKTKVEILDDVLAHLEQ